MNKKLGFSILSVFVVVTFMLVGFTTPAGAKIGQDIINSIFSNAPSTLDDVTEQEDVDDSDIEMTGTVESISAESWVISGVTYLITTSTDIDENIIVGDTVDVEAISDGLGGYIASEIELVDDDADDSDTDDIDDELEMTGVVESITAGTWVISGVTFVVDGSTEIEGAIGVGDTVDVEAISDGLGGYIATEIELVDDDADDSDTDDIDDELEMTGVVESITAGTWVISGVTFLVTADTEIDETIIVGDTVDVEAISDGLGGYIATEIELVDDDAEDTETDDDDTETDEDDSDTDEDDSDSDEDDSDSDDDDTDTDDDSDDEGDDSGDDIEEDD